MVRKLLKILNWEIGGLHEAAFLLAISSLASQVLALLRDRLLAGTFGAGKELDIYYAAFRIPDFLFISIGSFMAITVLIPILVGKIENGNGEGIPEAKKFLSDILTVFSFVMAIAAAVAFYFIPELSKLIAPGFDVESSAQLVTLSRIILLSPFLLGISNLLGSITQSFKKFFVYALSPILYNFGIILGVVVFYPMFGLRGLAYGVVAGALMHLAVQIPTIFELGMLPRFTLSINFRDLWRVISLSLPRALALGANQLALMFLVATASLMKAGSIAVFNLAYNLQSVPMAIIGVSYSVAALPEMSRIYSCNDTKKFVNYVETAFKHILFWSIQASALFVVLRAQIVRTILGSGQFDWGDTKLTAAVLAIFTISIIAQNLIQLLDRVYYAAGNNMKPVATKIISAILTVVSAYGVIYLFQNNQAFHNSFEYFFRVGGVEGTEILMLPLAFSIGAFLNLFLLFAMFLKDFSCFSKDFLRTLLQSIISAFVMGVTAYYSLIITAPYWGSDTLIKVFSHGFVAGILGIIAGVITLKLLKNSEIAEIEKAIKKSFWKTETIIPGPNEV